MKDEPKDAVSLPIGTLSAKLKARRKLVRTLDRASLEEMIGDKMRPWAKSRADLEDIIVNNWEHHWAAVEGRIQGLFRKAF